MNEKRFSITMLFLLLFLMVIYIRPYDFFLILEPLKLTRVTIILALFFCFFEKQNKTFVFKESSFLLFLALQLLSLALVPISVWKGHSLSFTLDTYLKIFLCFYIILVTVNSERKLDVAIRTIFLSCAIVAVRVILAYHNDQIVFDADGTKRIFGIASLASSNSNDLALVLAMSVPLGLYFIYVRRFILTKFFYVGVTVLILISILFTGSRGGYLGVLLGVICFFTLFYRNRKFQWILMALALSVLTLVVMPQEYKARFASIFNKEGYSYTSEKYGRIAIWKRGIESIKERPVGIGIDNYQLSERIRREEIGITGQWMAAHNSYIQIGVELGVLGMILYFLFLSSGLSNVGRTMRLLSVDPNFEMSVCAYALGAALVAFLTSSFFLSQAYYWNQYIFIALIVALKDIIRGRTKAPIRKV